MLVCDATPVLAQTASTAPVLNVSKGSANANPARPIRLIIPLPHVPRCHAQVSGLSLSYVNEKLIPCTILSAGYAHPATSRWTATMAKIAAYA